MEISITDILEIITDSQTFSIPIKDKIEIRLKHTEDKKEEITYYRIIKTSSNKLRMEK